MWMELVIYINIFLIGMISTYGVRSMMIFLHHQAKTPNGFWCRRGLKLNSLSLIRQKETLPIELIGPYISLFYSSILSNEV